MQDKVQPEDATMPVYVGIDVCKGQLDIYIHLVGHSFSVANDAGGWRWLKRVLADYTVERVVMEATSKYHRAAHRSLAAAGLAVAVVNPLRARLFAQACGVLAKTDAIDARMLALLGERLDPAAVQPMREAVEALQELDRARATAVEERVAIRLRRQTTTNSFLRTELARRIRALDTHIERLEAEIGKVIAADPVLARRSIILRSIPGIAAVVSASIIANLDEIGQLTGHQAAALAGLAPFAHDSGPQKGSRAIRGGRKHLRCQLYMAALSASRYNPDLKAFKERLRGNGKKAKVALTAVARKLLVLANTLVSEDRVWTAVRP